MKSKNEIIVEASLDNLDITRSFVEEFLRENHCPVNIVKKIAVAFEEIFVNVASYAYGDTVGQCSVEIKVIDVSGEYTQKTIITIKDKGVEFNPLNINTPDITLSVEERQMGGLGIFIAKNTMDSLTYLRNEEENVLVMEKSW